ncbi:MAG TPA: hypothetical protein DD624_01615 [Alphaproteobacteria bacterium]|nr:hypothetical protein [Alphaproteobacteria bacterium]
MATATEGEEYKLLHQTSFLIKAARIFSLIWILAVIAPAMYFIATYGESIKEFAVVRAVGTASNVLADQYDAFTDKVLKSVDIDKYTAQLKIPEIKLDTSKLEKLTKTTDKAKKLSSTLSKLGVKEADNVNKKITEATDTLQTQVGKINKQLKSSTDELKAALNKNVRDGLKKEVSALASSQMQKQLALSDSAYKKVVKGNYGLMSEQDRKATASVYKELKKGGIFKNAVRKVDACYTYGFWAVLIVVLVLLLIPPFIAMKLAKKFSAVFTQCPYCNKVFMTKGNGVNLLKLIKFW